jgi:hypothetical protein
VIFLLASGVKFEGFAENYNVIDTVSRTILLVSFFFWGFLNTYMANKPDLVLFGILDVVVMEILTFSKSFV